MKPTYFIKLLIVIFSIPLFNSCKKTEFSRRDTIISGNVTNQDGNPVKDFAFTLISHGKTSQTSTKNTTTDEYGNFTFSHRVPKRTDFLFLSLKGPDSIEVYDTTSPDYHYVSYEKEGNYELIVGATLHVPHDQWGKSIELRFKIEKP